MKQQGALEKTIAVLEALARTPATPLPLRTVAEASGLTRPTAAHILRRLGALGYAEQEARRGGYRLGPAVWALTRGAPYRRDLVRAAEPHLARLARETGESVVLVALRNSRRLRLCGIEGGGVLRVSEDVVSDDDIYRTPTGRLLLAHAAPHERETCLAVHGPPAADWPEAPTPAALEKALEALRRHRGCLVLRGPEVTGLACVLREGDHVPAALGLYLPTCRFRGSRRRRLPRRLEEVAAEISATISRPAGNAPPASCEGKDEQRRRPDRTVRPRGAGSKRGASAPEESDHE